MKNVLNKVGLGKEQKLEASKSFSKSKKPTRRSFEKLEPKKETPEKKVQSKDKKNKDKTKNKQIKKPKRESDQRPNTTKKLDSQVSGPFQVTHRVGVTTQMEWHGADPLTLFRLEHKLGEGAFGTVWKVSLKNNQDGLQLAVKHIKIESDTDTDEIENEIAILKKCKSDYIVSYYGIYKTETHLWILMDYCELGSVLDMMERVDAALGEPCAVWVIKSTLLGLQYLHSTDIIHSVRDVKAANILATRDGDLKVADFGVSETLSQAVEGEIAGSYVFKT